MLYLSLLFVDPSATAWAATLSVGPAQPFVTIDSAIQAAAAGDTIAIDPGVYMETLVVDKELEIVGTAPGVVVQHDGVSYDILSASAPVTLRDLEIDGLGTAHSAVRGTSADPMVLERVVVHDVTSTGVHGGDHLDLIDCEVHGTSLYGVRSSGPLHIEGSWLHDNDGDAVFMTAGDTVVDSVLSDNQTGVWVGGSFGRPARLEGNVLADNGIAVHTHGANTNLRRIAFLHGNVIQGGNIGVYAYNARYCGYYGCDPQRTMGIALAQNTIIDTVTGVLTTGGVRLLMSNNTVAHNDNGVWGTWGGFGSPLEPVLRSDFNVWFDNTEDVLWMDAGVQVPRPPLGLSALIGVDPLHVSFSDDGNWTNDDLTPQATSPLIDAGDPNYLDDDGTVSDIGHHTVQ